MAEALKERAGGCILYLMRIRAKFAVITGSLFGCIVVLSLLSWWLYGRTASIRHTVDTGIRMIAQARYVHGLTKNIVFDMFAPEMYGLLRGLIHAPRPSAVFRQWEVEMDRFRTQFSYFMGLPELQSLLTDAELREGYEVAQAMSAKAFQKIDSLGERIGTLRSLGLIGAQDSYSRIQSQLGEDYYLIFGEIRETSFYLTNNFESFLSHFVNSLSARGEDLQRRILLIFWILTALTGCITLSLPLFVAGRIVASLRLLEGAIRGLSRGDFSMELILPSRDEFGDLSSSFNRFVKDLEKNVNAVVSLLKDLGAAVKNGEGNLHGIVTNIMVKDTRALGALLYIRSDDGGYSLAAWSGTVPRGENGENLLTLAGAAGRSRTLQRLRPARDSYGAAAVPLTVPDRLDAVLVACAPAEGLTDLDCTHLVTFAQYAALVLDNYYHYLESLGRKEAEYQALQSQIQPHFLYNTLNGFMGMNRLGDREGLERSILALRELLRYSLDRRNMVAMKDEFHFLRTYLELQRIRFSDRFDYELLCGPEAEDLPIPKLLLQPLVENAVVHGIEPCDRRARLLLTARRDGGAVVVDLEDDGVGFDPWEEKSGDRQPVGILNVEQRLRLAYPLSTFSLDSAPGRGTRVKIRLVSGETP